MNIRFANSPKGLADLEKAMEGVVLPVCMREDLARPADVKQGSPEHRLLVRLWALGHCWNEELLVSSSIRARSRAEEKQVASMKRNLPHQLSPNCCNNTRTKNEFPKEEFSIPVLVWHSRSPNAMTPDFDGLGVGHFWQDHQILFRVAIQALGLIIWVDS